MFDSIKKVLWLSIGLHFIAVCFSAGFHHYDEHFQIIEFLNFKLGGIAESELPWEYRDQIRPWIQVFFYYLIVFPLKEIGIENPFILVGTLRFVSALSSLVGLWFLFRATEEYFENKLKYFCYLNLLWLVPYVHVRPSSESLSATLFFVGLYPFLKKREIGGQLLAGIFFGLSFFVRFQMGFAVAGVWMWSLLIRRERFGLLSLSAVGILFATGLGAFFDFWGYGTWTFSPYNYFVSNILEGKLNSFGVDPFHYYFTKGFLRGIPPLSLVFIGASLFFWFKKPKNVITWFTVPFFLVHCLASHKELRFIFFVMLVFPIFVLYMEENIQFKFKKGIRKFLLVMNTILLLLVIIRPASSMISFYSYVWNNSEIKEITIKGANPFSQVGLNLNFYMPKNLVFKKVEKFGAETTGYLFGERGSDFNTLIQRTGCELRFSGVPLWSLKFNIFNWVERSKIWTLFKCE